MLAKEDRKIISKIGRYKYKKMKEMNLSFEEFLEYEKKKEQEKKTKKQIGYREYNKMKELELNYEEYKQYKKEQKFKKYERKREKDKIRFKTIRYIERYCNLKMKCQICKTEEDIQIHHPNYNDYLKVNILCREHHTALHNFELVPPKIINLEKIAIRRQPQKEKNEYVETHIKNIKEDIVKNGYSYKELEEKYQISRECIKKHLEKENEWKILENNLKEVGKKKANTCNLKHLNNPLQKYRIENNLTAKELSIITKIPVPTIRAIECGKTDLSKIKPFTKQKLNFLLTK